MKKSIQSIDAYPLTWPEGWKRTFEPENSRFRPPSFAVVRDRLMDELRKMGVSDPILSTNIPLKKNGLPYAIQSQPTDPGVAVYFTYQEKPMVFACDRWRTVSENMQAIQKTIDAIRGIERWGASDMMEKAFRGFTALPDHTSEEWFQVLEVSPNSIESEVRGAFKRLAKKYHPDMGDFPNPERMQKVNEAYEQYKSQNQNK